jgi:hypothetical protein
VVTARQHVRLTSSIYSYQLKSIPKLIIKLVLVLFSSLSLPLLLASRLMHPSTFPSEHLSSRGEPSQIGRASILRNIRLGW